MRRGARRVKAGTAANKDDGHVIADLCKMCLRARGWNRVQQVEPVRAGWYRVIEGDGPMKFAPPPAREPASQPRS